MFKEVTLPAACDRPLRCGLRKRSPSIQPSGRLSHCRGAACGDSGLRRRSLYILHPLRQRLKLAHNLAHGQPFAQLEQQMDMIRHDRGTKPTDVATSL